MRIILIIVPDKMAASSTEHTKMDTSDGNVDGKAEETSSRSGEPKYKQSCLYLLPEELLQELYGYITSPPFPGNWLYADIYQC